MITSINNIPGDAVRFFTVPIDLIYACFSSKEWDLSDDSDPAAIKAVSALITQDAYSNPRIQIATELFFLFAQNPAFHQRVQQIDKILNIDSPDAFIAAFPNMDKKVAAALNKITLPDLYNSAILPQIAVFLLLMTLGIIWKSEDNNINNTTLERVSISCAALASIPEFSMAFWIQIASLANIQQRNRADYTKMIFSSLNSTIMKKAGDPKASLAPSTALKSAVKSFILGSRSLEKIVNVFADDFDAKYLFLINAENSIINRAISHVFYNDEKTSLDIVKTVRNQQDTEEFRQLRASMWKDPSGKLTELKSGVMQKNSSPSTHEDELRRSNHDERANDKSNFPTISDSLSDLVFYNKF